MAPKVLISDALSDAAVQIFRDRGVDVDYMPKLGKDKEKLAEIIGQYDGLAIRSATKVTANLLEKSTRLKVVGRAGIGVDNVDLEAARRRNIPVCNIPEYCVAEVADHTLAFILAMVRQVVPNTVHIRAGGWGMATPLASMAAMKDLTVGIIGFGRIGREVVRRLSPFNCRILVFDPVATKESITSAGAVPAGSLDELLNHYLIAVDKSIHHRLSEGVGGTVKAYGG